MSETPIPENGTVDEFVIWLIQRLLATCEGPPRITFEVDKSSEEWKCHVTHSNEHEVRVEISKRLVHDLGLIVRSLLVDSTALSFIEREKKRTEDVLPVVEKEEVAESLRKLIFAGLEGGVPTYLHDDFNKEHGHCWFTNQLLQLDELALKTSRVATISAIFFILQHEVSHALSVDTVYKIQRQFSASPEMDSREWSKSVGPDFRLLELCADFNAHRTLFIPAFGLSAEFSDQKSDPMYLASISAGLGIGAYFLFLDSIGVEDDVHPYSDERMFWMCFPTISRCRNEKVEESDVDTHLRVHRRGLFRGIGEVVRLWDLRGLPRKRSPYLERFISDGFPCLVCNQQAPEIVTQLRKLASNLSELDGRMERTGAFRRRIISLWTTLSRPSWIAHEILSETNNLEERRQKVSATLSE